MYVQTLDNELPLHNIISLLGCPGDTTGKFIESSFNNLLFFYWFIIFTIYVFCRWGHNNIMTERNRILDELDYLEKYGYFVMKKLLKILANCRKSKNNKIISILNLNQFNFFILNLNTNRNKLFYDNFDCI